MVCNVLQQLLDAKDMYFFASLCLKPSEFATCGPGDRPWTEGRRVVVSMPNIVSADLRSGL